MSIRMPPRAMARHVPIGTRLRTFREAAGMLQREVARRLNVSPTCVANWESGYRAPHIDMIDAYLRVVGGTITLGLPES